MNNNLKNKIKLTVLLLITALPVGLATMAFKAAVESGAVSNTANKGVLINPPIDISALAMKHEDGQPVFRNFEEEIASLASDQEYQIRPWLMLYVNNSECESSCQERIHYMQQLHVALGKNIERVRRYYLNTSGEALSAENAELFRNEYQSMGIAIADRDVLQQNLSNAGVSLNLAEKSYILLIDPVGNIMMYYTDEHTAEDIMADLETLLKYSSLG